MALSRKIALTVDLEEWTVPQDFGGRPRVTVPEAVKLEVARRGLHRLLDILSLEQVKATFFVTAYFAQRNLPLLREMLKAGHEIGNHGLDHGPRAGLTWNEWLEGIRISTHTLEDLLRTKPCGYREPYFAITRQMIGALIRVGYLYDSSVLGTWLPSKYRQWVAVPSSPFVWRIERGDARLVELPVSVFSILRIPVGWWWFRKNCGELIPSITGELLFRLDQPFITEMHSWELAEVPEGYRTPFHVRYNCGRRSADQILHLIRRLKRSGGNFVLMKTLALEVSKAQNVRL